MKLSLLYVTCGSQNEARKIGKALVKSRLAACVNIIDNMNSMYWWEGKIQDDHEVVLIAKTREDLVPKVIGKVKSLHSYSCPCIVALPIEGGNKDFLDWIQKETRVVSHK